MVRVTIQVRSWVRVRVRVQVWDWLRVRVRDDSQPLPDNKLFVQDMFPYPSGMGLHVGHPLGYIATDVYARYQRMLGKNVLHTLGYDSFGLPAEQYAIQTGTHPRATTMANIENYERQLGALGLGHDRRRKVATTDPEFYRWTQWIFLQIFNSWFDPEKAKARPIAELIPLLESGEIATPAVRCPLRAAGRRGATTGH